jgi:hypothetical protein
MKEGRVARAFLSSGEPFLGEFSPTLSKEKAMHINTL